MSQISICTGLKDTLVSTPVFGQLIARDRFHLLLIFLDVANNKNCNVNGTDRDILYKIREFENIRRFCNMYCLRKKQNMDERLVTFKGRLSFKQFMKSMGAGFGIVLSFVYYWWNCPCLHYISWNMAHQLTELQGSLIREEIPATLIQKYLGKGHHLYIGKYYTSMSLAQYFLENDICNCNV